MNIVGALRANNGGPDDNKAQANHLVAFQASDYAKGAYESKDQSRPLTTSPDRSRAAPLVLGDVTHTLRGEGFDASEDGTGRGTPIVPVAFQSNASVSQSMNPSEVAPALDCAKAGGTAVAYQCHGSNVGPMGTLRSGNGNESGGVPFAIQERAVSENIANGPQGKGYQSGTAFTLEARHHQQSVAGTMGVRRLMPVECLRLQGFPDDWLDGLELSDSAKYKMCGNAVCVNVAEWIGRRIVECSK